MTKQIIQLVVLCIILVLSGGFDISTSPLKFKLTNPYYSFGLVFLAVGIILMLYGFELKGYHKGVDFCIEEIKKLQTK